MRLLNEVFILSSSNPDSSCNQTCPTGEAGPRCSMHVAFEIWPGCRQVVCVLWHQPFHDEFMRWKYRQLAAGLIRQLNHCIKEADLGFGLIRYCSWLLRTGTSKTSLGVIDEAQRRRAVRQPVACQHDACKILLSFAHCVGPDALNHAASTARTKDICDWRLGWQIQKQNQRFLDATISSNETTVKRSPGTEPSTIVGPRHTCRWVIPAENSSRRLAA